MHAYARSLARALLAFSATQALGQRAPTPRGAVAEPIGGAAPSSDFPAPTPPALSGLEVTAETAWSSGGPKERHLLQSLGAGDSVGYTTYDFQTNGAMPERIINWPAPTGENGFLSTMIAMAATSAAPTWDDRGTYGAVAINGGNGIEWLPITIDRWRRVESERAGFCDIDHLADSSVVFVSHTGNGVVFSRESRPGSAEYTTVEIPGADRGLWARVAVGDNDYVHVIWTYQNTEPEYHILRYARSTDGGATWETPVDLTGAGSVLGQTIRGVQGGDGYALDASGPHVVVWYQTQNVDIIQLRSRDNGSLWSIDDAIFVSRVSYQRRYTTHSDPDSVYWADPEISADTAVGFRSDTAAAPGSSFDLIVEQDGRVRGVYPVYPTYLVRYYLNGQDTTASTYGTGTIYQAAFNYTDVAFVYFTELDGQASQGIVPLPPGLANPNMFLQPRSYSHGFGRWPNLGRDATGNLYVVYTSGADGDVVTGTPSGATDERTYYRGHTYITWTRDGAVWAHPQNLTPNGVDAQFATLADVVDDELHITYQADTYPGDYLTSSGTNGSTLHPSFASNHEVLLFPIENLNTIGVDGASPYAGATVRVLPNPAGERAVVDWAFPKAGRVSLRIFDALGNHIWSVLENQWLESGAHSAGLSLRELPAGNYFARLSGPGGIHSVPFRVVR